MTSRLSAPLRKEEIMTIATELFGEFGFAKVSLRQIADRAGITKAALYYHYASKELILDDLFQAAFTEGDEIVAGYQQTMTQEDFGTLLFKYFDHLWKHRTLLCHIACDPAVLSTTEIGPRIVFHISQVVNVLSTDEQPANRVRAKAALGALQGPITLAEPGDDHQDTAKVAVGAALACLEL